MSLGGNIQCPAGENVLHVTTPAPILSVYMYMAMEALKCYSESSEDEHSSVSESGITKKGVS